MRRCPVSKTWLPLRTCASSTCNSDLRSKKSLPLTQRPVDDLIRPLFSTDLSYNDLKIFFCQPYCRQHIRRQLVFYGISVILQRFPGPETKRFFRKSGWTSSSECASACNCEAEYVRAFPLTKTLTRASSSLEGDLPTGSPAVRSLDFPFHSSSGIPSFVRGEDFFAPTTEPPNPSRVPFRHIHAPPRQSCFPFVIPAEAGIQAERLPSMVNMGHWGNLGGPSPPQRLTSTGAE